VLAGGTEAFKKLIDHPLANILLASIEVWQEAKKLIDVSAYY
jgi:hypothetical protein